MPGACGAGATGACLLLSFNYVQVFCRWHDCDKFGDMADVMHGKDGVEKHGVEILIYCRYLMQMF